MLTDAEFENVYGHWAPRAPADAARLFAGYDGTWWIAGGWALEAYTGVHREHEDLDPSVLLVDLAALRRHLTGRLHTWMASSGALKPLLEGDRPDAAADELLIEGCNQLWTRCKARGLRPKDDADFAATAPFLDSTRREWLRAALAQTIPDHDWLTRL